MNFSNDQRILPFVGGLLVGGIFAPPKGGPVFGGPAYGAPSYAPPLYYQQSAYPTYSSSEVYYDPTMIYYNGNMPNMPQGLGGPYTS